MAGMLRIGIGISAASADLLKERAEEFDVSQSKLIEALLRLPLADMKKIMPGALAQLDELKKERLSVSQRKRDLVKNLTPEQLESLLKGNANA